MCKGCKIREQMKAMSPLEKIEFFFSLILSVLIVALTVIFIDSAVTIYFGGGASPYSREAVALHLTKVAPLSFTTVILAAIAGIISLFTKKKKTATLPIRPRIAVKLLERTIKTKMSDAYLLAKAKEAKFRKRLLLVFSSLGTVVGAVSLFFILDPARYTVENLNTDIAYSVVIAGIAVLIILVLVYVYSYFSSRSYARAANAAKENLREINRDPQSPDEQKPDNKSLYNRRTMLIVRCTCFIFAALFITLGIFNGGMADVLGKAVRICTECIGLG